MPTNRLKALRESHHYTLDQMAQKTGIKRGTINNYENGKTEPKLETWKKLANFFNVSVSYLQGIEPSYKKMSDSDFKEFQNFEKNHTDYETTNYLRLKSLYSLDINKNAGWEYEKHLTDQQIDSMLSAISDVFNSRLAYLGNESKPDPNIEKFFSTFNNLLNELYSAALNVHMPGYDDSKHGIDFKKLESIISPTVSKLREVNKKMNAEEEKQDEEYFKKHGTYPKH
jgi:transcriptional regulator with XRE-family HTH domain